jgi:putative hydrolase of the HAD superfamily
MISSFLFDFGGTLDADGLHWLDRFYEIYRRFGFSHISKPLIKEAFYWADAQADADSAMKTSGFRAMMERHVQWQFEKLGLSDRDKAAELAAAFYKPSERVLRRNYHVLERLRQMDLKLGVISNFYGNVEFLCKEAKLCDFLDVVLDSMVVGLRKPDPKLFQLALERMGAEASQTGFVGDSFERDIIPAKALGMRTFWLLGDHRKLTASPPEADHLLYSLEDLPALVAELRMQEGVR